MTSSSLSFFDVTSATSAPGGLNAAQAKGFSGGVFDGKYIYFIPQNNGAPDGIIARFDTSTSAFFDSSSTAWSFFDVTTATAAPGGTSAPNAKGFVGGVFDGRYIYFAPSNDGAPNGIVARYDTTSSADFNVSTSAWSFIDITVANVAPGGSNAVNAKGFGGAVYDGRYVYLIPNNNGVPNGIVARYDTTTSLSFEFSFLAWSFFDIATATTTSGGMNAPSAKGFMSAAFDGRFIYFIPWNNGVLNGIIARYDTTSSKDFNLSATAWSFFDLTTASGADGGSHANLAKGYVGGVFDGRFLYLIPGSNGIAARYDTSTTQSFEVSAQAWSFFDITTATSSSGGSSAPSATGFSNAAYDGRFIYLIPLNNGAPDGVVARYDTASLGLFSNSQTSWSFFDLTTAISAPGGSTNANHAKGYNSSVFDGRYLYLVPFNNATAHGVVVRYDTLGSQASYELKSAWGYPGGISSSFLGPSFQVSTVGGFFSANAQTAVDSGLHFLAGVYDSSTVSLYVDGVLVASRPAFGSILSNTNPLKIGTFGESSSSYSGIMNDIQIYGTALSASDIQNIYLSGEILCR